ncbi:sensor histidine kinase [Catelliglobosispora koreensis]|uniref:sensor histidine kinase n=1 Tax=Catelliglobosispora koreensis TaxID=129052 RepID=UPI00039C39C9|nr:histidine kinase [Catelliglobosispora koreensis]
MKRYVTDGLLALLLVVPALFGSFATQEGGGPSRPLDAFGIALIVGCCLVLAVRRRWPVATMLASATTCMVYLVVPYTYGPIFFVLTIAVYSAGRYGQLNRALAAAGVSVLLLVTHVFTGASGLPGFYGVIPAVAWIAVPFSVGVAVRLVKEARQRDRAELIRQHVDDERLRVAQEVHDVVAHGLAAIKMQADVALHVFAKKPEQATVALEAISRTSGVALEELRMALATVRAPAASTPGLEQVPGIVERMMEAGLRVNLRVNGQRPALPPVTDLYGYRVVQESLTNVLRHAGASEAAVTIDYAPETVSITVTNPVGRVSGSSGSGSGINGMRQRVEAVGGEFSAGKVSSDRFEVRAILPLGGTA